jgi:hypothetical protein
MGRALANPRRVVLRNAARRSGSCVALQSKEPHLQGGLDHGLSLSPLVTLEDF